MRKEYRKENGENTVGSFFSTAGPTWFLPRAAHSRFSMCHNPALAERGLSLHARCNGAPATRARPTSYHTIRHTRSLRGARATEQTPGNPIQVVWISPEYLDPVTNQALHKYVAARRHRSVPPRNPPYTPPQRQG
jgi:hypothetical protein